MALNRDPNSDLTLPTVRIDGWQKGMDNLRKGYDIGDGFLRDAVNVDISNFGKVKRRTGTTMMYPDYGCHSLYATDKYMIYVLEGFIVTWDANHNSIDGIAVNPTAPFAYETVNGEVYCTNRYINLKVGTDGLFQHWGIDVPSNQPTVTTTTGSLAAGTYQVAITFVNSYGEESGTNLAVTATVTDNGGIELTNIPVPTSPVTTFRVYVSYANGGEMYLYNEYPIATSIVLISASRIGPQLRTQFMSPLPYGTDIAYSQGRLITANDNFLYYSQPLRYGIYNNTADFIWMPDPIKLIWGAFDGVYVATKTQTFFLTGAGTPEQKLELVMPTGAIPGTKAKMPDKVGEMWMTPKGVVRAYVGGKIENISYDKVSIGDYSTGAAIIREDDGLRRFISSVKLPKEGTQFATMDFFDAEVVKP